MDNSNIWYFNTFTKQFENEASRNFVAEGGEIMEYEDYRIKILVDQHYYTFDIYRNKTPIGKLKCRKVIIDENKIENIGKCIGLIIDELSSTIFFCLGHPFNYCEGFVNLNYIDIRRITHVFEVDNTKLFFS